MVAPNYSYSKPERWKNRIYAPNEAEGCISGVISLFILKMKIVQI